MIPARLLPIAVLGVCGLIFCASAGAATCRDAHAAREAVAGPTARAAWRAELIEGTGVHRRLPTSGARPSASVGPADADALLVLRVRRDRGGRCWLRVRLPSRPNAAYGWIRAGHTILHRTLWRITVSRRARTVTLRRAGRRVKRLGAVIGNGTTPTPTGLVSIVHVWPWHAGDFLGSWVLPLTVHSDVLARFDGGDGRVAIHGRGGSSLNDRLGSAASHGCIRLANSGIDWLVRRVGVAALPGVPVRIR